MGCALEPLAVVVLRDSVRLPISVHLRCVANGLSGTACRTISGRRGWDLPVLAQESSTRVSGL